MRLFARPASEAHAIEQGVALLMKSYEELPPHPIDEDAEGHCYVIVVRPNDGWFGINKQLDGAPGLKALLGIVDKVA